MEMEYDGTPILISSTAIQTGFGSMLYKTVIHMSSDERKAARDGAIVIFDSGRPADGRYGTTWRMAVPFGKRFYPRVPCAGILKAAGVEVERQPRAGSAVKE